MSGDHLCRFCESAIRPIEAAGGRLVWVDGDGSCTCPKLSRAKLAHAPLLEPRKAGRAS